MHIKYAACLCSDYLFFVMFVMFVAWGKIDYSKKVRPELLKLIRVAPVDIVDLCELIEETESLKIDEDTSVSESDTVAEELLEDTAMQIYSLAQRCINVENE